LPPIRYYGMLTSSKRADNVACAPAKSSRWRQSFRLMPSKLQARRRTNPRPTDSKPTNSKPLSIPALLRRPRNHHRDLRARVSAQTSAHSDCRDNQDRYIMNTPSLINDRHSGFYFCASCAMPGRHLARRDGQPEADEQRQGLDRDAKIALEPLDLPRQFL
jgi:hypothetical protein